jgi:hypothetical protein
MTTTTPSSATTTPSSPVSDAVALWAAISELQARVVALECGAPVRALPAKALTPKVSKPRYVTIPQAKSNARHNLWMNYLFFRGREVRGSAHRPNRRRGEHSPASRQVFAHTMGLSLREFDRWFQLTNTHAVDSPQDIKIRGRMDAEIERLRSDAMTAMTAMTAAVTSPAASHGKE